MNFRYTFTCVLAAAALSPHHALAATLTLQDVIVKVEHDMHAKVLSAETKKIGRQTIYRIKVLTRGGEVKVVEISADGS